MKHKVVNFQSSLLLNYFIIIYANGLFICIKMWKYLIMLCYSTSLPSCVFSDIRLGT